MKSRLRIQYASGIQFTGGPPQPLLKPVAPILALVDHNLHPHFLQYCSRNWDEVFVLGPAASQYPNVQFLNRDRVNCRSLTILGTYLEDNTDRVWLGAQLANCRQEGTPTVVITKHLPPAGFIRPPTRAWIADAAPANMITTIEFPDGEVQCVVNTYRACGYSREIFVDISTEPGIGDTRDPLLVAASE